MDYSKQRDKTIVLKEKGKISQFYIENIIYVQCESYMSTVHLNNTDKTETFSILLKEIEKEVTGYGFFRINRNTIANLKYFKCFINGNKKCFVTINGTEMKVSRRKWYNLKKTIEGKIPLI